MPSFRKNFDGLADTIITDAVIVETTEIKPGQPLPKYHYTENACWDTGAQFTVISPRVVQALNLKPTGKGGVMGIGGDRISNTYTVQIALPNGDLVNDIVVYCSDIDDYDILLGMDVINLLDVVITNTPTTVFSFRYPSEGNVELK